MITCTRRLQFCCGHRIQKHESKCRNLHGHNYVAFFEARADILDRAGRIIDFGVLKQRIGGWIDAEWDHGFVLDAADSIALDAVKLLPGQKIFTVPFPPTAENMASYLLRVVCPQVMADSGVEVFRVTLWETENCYASDQLGGAATAAAPGSGSMRRGGNG